MNKKNLIIEIVLGAVIILVLIMQFKDNTNKEPQDSQKQNENVSSKTGNLNVAYINTDSLVEHYKLAQKLNQQFADQQKQSRRELDQRMRKFEKNYKEFQEKVQRGGFLTQSSAKAQQEKLQAEQQELQKLQQELSNGLMAKEQGIYQEIYDSISNFVAEYNKNKNYDLILSNTVGGSIIYGKQRFNITAEILKKLNRRYDRRKRQ